MNTAEPDRPVPLADAAALDAFVDEHELALVAFHTAGCGLCAAMNPVLSNVARASEAAVGTVNPRDDPPLVERFDVRSVPLLVVFVGGDPVARRAEGFVGTEELVAWVRTARSDA